MSGRSMNLAGAEEGFQSARRSYDAELDLTPMIDVVFLLLIFFMVTSSMQRKKELDVPAAKHGVGIDDRQSVVISILKPVSPDLDPEIRLSDNTVGELEDVPGDVARHHATGTEDVIIKADRDVPHGFVAKVMRKAAEIEGVHLHVEVRDATGRR